MFLLGWAWFLQSFYQILLSWFPEILLLQYQEALLGRNWCVRINWRYLDIWYNSADREEQDMWSQLLLSAKMTWCSTVQSLTWSFPNAGLLLSARAESSCGTFSQILGNLGKLTLLISVGIRAGLGLFFVCDLPRLQKKPQKNQVDGLPLHFVGWEMFWS